jgi:hypothetical protein
LFLTQKKKAKSKMDVAPEAWHLATAFKNMQLWRKEKHKHSQEEWATNFRTYYFQNICWCELLANNTKKKNDWFFTMHTFFCEQQIPRLKVLQIFLTKDEVKKKWRRRRRKYQFSSSLFSVLLLFLKLAKLSKENKWNNHTHGLELTWNLKRGRLAKLDKFGGAPFQWRRQRWEKCDATINRGEGRCVYR